MNITVLLYISLVNLLIYSPESQALGCGIDAATKFKADPDSVKMAVVGRLKGDKYRVYDRFIVQRGWTASPQEFQIHNPEECDTVRQELNKAYLIIGMEDLDKNNVIDASYSSALLFPLFGNEAKKFIEILANKVDYKHNKVNPSWQFCESDNECIQSKNHCGNPVGVNKKYENNYLSFLKIKKAKFNCLKEEKSKSSVSKCVDNFCS